MSRARAQVAAPAYSALDSEADKPVASVWIAARPAANRCEELQEIATALRALELRRAVLLREIRKDKTLSDAAKAKARMVDLVSAEYGLAPGVILGPDRSGPVAEARNVARWLVWVCSECSLAEVGRHFGCDPALVSYSARVVLNRIGTEPNFSTRMNRLRKAAGFVTRTR